MNDSSPLITKLLDLNSSKENSMIDLNETQIQVLNHVFQNKISIFLDGAAGSGKSTVIKAIIKNSNLLSIPIAITASTGLAASSIGGITLHSWAGIGIGTDSVGKLISTIRARSEVKSRWLSTQILIIDEISMISAQLFDKLDKIARVIRNNHKAPFGGLQLVLSGDFHQLPPIASKTVKAELSSQGYKSSYCFSSKAWPQLINSTSSHCTLQTVYRQREVSFVRILNQLRRGIVTTGSRLAIESLLRKDITINIQGKSIRPTVMTSRVAAATKYNETELAKLSGSPFIFDAVDSGADSVTRELDSICTAESGLTLKVGAQVILLTNRPKDQLFNGSRGVITEFVESYSSAKIPIQCDSRHTHGPGRGCKHAADYQSRVEVDDRKSFYPRVLFLNGKSLVIEPFEWKISRHGDVVATRSQIPLKLAWALTIHKSQGQTIDLARISIPSSFGYHMWYVALSRCSSLSAISLDSLPDFHSDFKIAPPVRLFYENLKNKLKEGSIIKDNNNEEDETFGSGKMTKVVEGKDDGIKLLIHSTSKTEVEAQLQKRAKRKPLAQVFPTVKTPATCRRLPKGKYNTVISRLEIDTDPDDDPSHDTTTTTTITTTNSSAENEKENTISGGPLNSICTPTQLKLLQKYMNNNSTFCEKSAKKPHKNKRKRSSRYIYSSSDEEDERKEEEEEGDQIDINEGKQEELDQKSDRNKRQKILL